ncbi:MAG: hypothetical protein KF796_19615 [Ramlibacter sp.]|nr:hypothetical protein [Ramlibacter sp.]
MREAATSPERDFRSLIDMARGAVDAVVNAGKLPGDRRYVSLTAMYSDRIVVELDGKNWQYGFSLQDVNGTETMVLTNPIQVVSTFAPVKAATRVKEAVEESFSEAQDGSGAIEVTLVRSGASRNGNYYPDTALKEAVPLFEGVRVFVKSDDMHLKGGGKDVRNLVGGIYGVRFVEGADPDSGRLVGTFRPLDPTDAVVKKMTEAVKRDMQDLLGLSIDAFAKTKKSTRGGKAVREATRFTKVASVDLIVEPGAGGGLDRLTEAAADEPPQGETAMPLWKQRMLEAIKAKDPAKHATIDANAIGDDELVNLHEAVCGSLVTGETGGQTRVAEAAGDATPLTRADLAMFQARQAAVTTINGSKLPQPAKDRLLADFGRRERFTEADVTSAIKDEGEYLGRFTESGTVRVPMFGAGSVVVGDKSLVVADMLDAFFDPTHKDHGRVQSIKECYIEITGDRQVTGRVRDCDQSRMREALGSGTFDDVLGDSITRRMLADYRAAVDFDGWRQIADVVPVSDFRTQERTRFGGYGDLPAVNEGADYTALTSPGDEKATYGVTKRGGLETITLEMIKNDDAGVVRRVPIKLSRAAKRTLAKFVFDFLRTNPTVYDTVAFFHASHANLFTAALDASSLSAHRLAMLKQTELTSADRIGIAPKNLVVPVDLQEAAVNLFKLSTNNEKTFIQAMTMNIIPVWYWTDANDWCTVADPMDIPGIEIGFLDGREEPELFVQDMPNVGSMFAADKLTYKIRHIYGGAVADYRCATKAVVA